MASNFVLADSFGGLEQAQQNRDRALSANYFNSLQAQLAQQQLRAAEQARINAANDDAARFAAALASNRAENSLTRADSNRQNQFNQQIQLATLLGQQRKADLDEERQAFRMTQPTEQDLQLQMLGQQEAGLDRTADSLAGMLNELGRVDAELRELPNKSVQHLFGLINPTSQTSDQKKQRQIELENQRKILQSFTDNLLKQGGGELITYDPQSNKFLSNRQVQQATGARQNFLQSLAGLSAPTGAINPPVSRLAQTMTQSATQPAALPQGPFPSQFVPRPITDPAFDNAIGGVFQQPTPSGISLLPRRGDRRARGSVVEIYDGLRWLPMPSG